MEDILKLAENVLARREEWVIVGSPITSGIRPDAENEDRLHRNIVWLKKQFVIAFNYLPLRKKAVEILKMEILEEEDTSKNQKHALLRRLYRLRFVVRKLLRNLFGKNVLTKKQEYELQVRLWERFFLPLLKTGKFRQLRIMPAWEASLIVQRMRQFALDNGIEIRFMPGPEELPE